ncbi:unnamed protein product [Arabidopsis halleri]
MRKMEEEEAERWIHRQRHRGGESPHEGREIHVSAIPFLSIDFPLDGWRGLGAVHELIKRGRVCKEILNRIAMAKNSFKLSNPLEMRMAESTRIRANPNRVHRESGKARQSDVPYIDKKNECSPRYCCLKRSLKSSTK